MAALTPMETVAELRTFLGAAGFLQRYVPEYAELAGAVRALDTLKKVGARNRAAYERIEWTEEAMAAFEAIKAALVAAPVLAFPDFSRPFIICVDASKTTVGGCLAQLDSKGVERPIAYFSCNLSQAQRNYGITDKECLGIVMACRKFRSYIAHSGAVLITDHSAALSLRNPKKEFTNDRLYRYAVELDQYQLVLAHRPGRELYMADLLSRAECMQDEQAVLELIKAAWAKTAGIAITKPSLREQLFELGAEQARLQMQIRGAAVPQPDGQTITVQQALAEMQAAGLQQPTGTVDEQSLRVFDMQDMVTADELQPRAYVLPATPQHSSTVIKAAQVASVCDINCVSADSDSEYSDSEEDTVAALYERDDDAVLKADVQRVQEQDSFCKQMKLYLKAGELPATAKAARRITLLAHTFGCVDGLIVHIARKQRWTAKMQWYLPDAEGIREQAITWLHRELVHPGVMKTVSHVAELFYWPSMFEDIRAEVRRCSTCQFFSQREGKAPVTGHQTADYPGQKIALDIMHLTPRPAVTASKGKAVHKAEQAKQQKQGKAKHDGADQYALTGVDVYSKKGFTIPISDLETSTISRAISQSVVVRCIPEEFVFDGGPEFKSYVIAGAKAYDASVHRTTPNHSRSLGVVERFNRTIQRILGKISAASGEQWQDVCAEATLTYDASPHWQLAPVGAEPLSPGELWYGAKIRLPSLTSFGAITDDDAPPTVYMKRLRLRLEGAHATLMEARSQYFNLMETSSKQRHRPLRKFLVGDLVTRYRPTDSLRVNKLSPLQDGPFEVLKCHPSGTSYWIKRQHSDESQVLVHVDQLNAFCTERVTRSTAAKLKKERQQAAPAAGAAAAPAVAAAAPQESELPQPAAAAPKVTKAKFVVKQVAAERLLDGKKQLLLEWMDGPKKGGRWKCTWEPLANLDCDERVSEWMMTSKAEKQRRRQAAELIGIDDAYVEVAAVSAVYQDADVRPVKMDISGDWGGHESILEYICELVGLDIDQVVLLWSSPPCESYSQLQYGMAEAGNVHRDTAHPQRPPRSRESCEKPSHHTKRKKAELHDRMNSRLTQSHVRDKRRGIDFTAAVENPAAGMLWLQPFMNTNDWTELTDRQLVDYCNYWCSLYHKPTGVCVTKCGWHPAGHSGTGRCCKDCHSGRWVWNENAPAGVSFKHDFQLGGPKDRAPPKEDISDRFHVPEELIGEVLAAAVNHRRQKSSKQLFVVDLFAGTASAAGIVADSGMGYVPVDICTDLFPEQFPSAVIG